MRRDPGLSVHQSARSTHSSSPRARLRPRHCLLPLRLPFLVPLLLVACGPQRNTEQTTGSSAALTAVPTSFDGIGHNYVGPSGTWTGGQSGNASGAIGRSHFVQMARGGIAMFDRTGVPVFGPATVGTLWAGVGAPCETQAQIDGAVAYDRLADRWIITHFAQSFSPTVYCVAVSHSGDPTGHYEHYSFPVSDVAQDLALGVWPDAYHVTYAVRTLSGSQLGTRVCALDRSRMLARQSATEQCFTLPSSAGKAVPTDLDGTTPAPAAAPGVMMAVDATTSVLNLWHLRVDWTTPSASSLTGPTALPIEPFTPPCGGALNCVPQPGTAALLNPLGHHPNSRAAYRNFGDHDAIVISHAVAAGSSTGIRWYEVRNPTATPTLFQQGTFAPDAEHRWLPSAAVNGNGTIALGYSSSSSSTLPGLRAAGRLAADAAGLMGQGAGVEGVLFSGTGVQSNGTDWSRSSTLTVDPLDDCTFWYTNVYSPTNAINSLRTRVVSFRIGTCAVSPPPRLLALSADPGTLEAGRKTIGRVTLTSGAPAGGLTVQLTSSAPARVTVPATVHVAAGAQTATFVIDTSVGEPQSAVPTTVSIAGSLPTGSSVVSDVTLLPPPVLTALTLTSDRVYGGVGTTGTVTLSGPAQAPGVEITLFSSNTAVATVPATVTVPAGSSSATFPITAASPTTGTSTMIVASLHGRTSRATLIVYRALALGTLSILPGAVEGGSGSAGTVRINERALSGGIVVALTSSDAALATVPATVTIPEGATSAPFAISTSPTPAAASVSITASLPSRPAEPPRSATLSLVPTSVESLAVAPAVVAGGRPILLTVTLSRPAPTGGFAASLSSSSGLLGVPATVTVPAGMRMHSVVVNTGSPTSSTVVTITHTVAATQNVRSTTVTVQPESGNAVFDSALGAPRCATMTNVCDTGPAGVRGRGGISGGAEPNAPNTLGAACGDGGSGAFHTSPSLDRLRISSSDGRWLAAGKQARVDATVWVTNTTSERFDLFFAPDANSPVWSPLATLAPLGIGQQTLSATITLPPGSLPAIRGNWRSGGATDACSLGATDDRDDLVFALVPGGADVTPPTVAVIGPAENGVRTRLTPVVVAAEDDVGVTLVSLYVDGSFVATASAAPYVFAVDTVILGDGPHQLEARAADAAGHETISATVTMVVDNTPPTLTLTAPVAGATVFGVVAATSWYSASDPSGIKQVELLADSVPIPGGFSSISTWELSIFNPTALVSARAVDNLGNVAVTPPVVVNIFPYSNRAPVVSAGVDQTVTLPGAVSLAGSVTDDGAPFNMPTLVTAFWSTVSGPGLVSFDNRTAPSTTARFLVPGTYVLRLAANDQSRFSSDDIEVTVLPTPPDTTPPSTTITSPANGSLIQGTMSVTVDAADDRGVTEVRLELDGAPLGTATAPPYAFAVDTSAIADGEHILQARAVDAANNVGVSSPVTIVVANQRPNRRPVVDAGPDQTVVLSSGAVLSGTVNDDGLPLPSALSVKWLKVLGPGKVTFADPTLASTTASFSLPGVYVLRLRASDGQLTASDEVRISVRRR